MKLSPDVLAKIKQIEIQTRRLISGALIGDKQSAIKGGGFEFDQIREYQMGDDVRTIDWNGSARMNKVLVKQYIEERNRNIMLLVDGSSSAFFSSGKELKFDTIARIASALAIIGDSSKDHVGLLLFTDQVEQYIPPRVGREHVHRIMQTLFEWQPTQQKTTSVACALEHIMKHRLAKSSVFIISDFIAPGFRKTCAVAARKHELIAIRCLDSIEQELPQLGIIPTIDVETGQMMLLDTRKHIGLRSFLMQRVHEQNAMFKKHQIDCLDVNPARPFVGQLVRFFRQRMRY